MRDEHDVHAGAPRTWMRTRALGHGTVEPDPTQVSALDPEMVNTEHCVMRMTVSLSALLWTACNCAGGNVVDASMMDVARLDASGTDSGSADAGLTDAGRTCSTIGGACAEPGANCLCCPRGKGTQCLCTQACMNDSDCTVYNGDSCHHWTGGGETTGICGPPTLFCVLGVCASPDTPIATPLGERPIAELREGDLVYSVDHDTIVAVPIARTSRIPVVDHRVVRVLLESGRSLEISAAHPTADGRAFADLASGGALDGVGIVEAREIPYSHPFTYDILPASDTGSYYASGVLIGSTLSSHGTEVACAR